MVAWNSLVREFEDKLLKGEEEIDGWCGDTKINEHSKLYKYHINPKTPKTTTVFGIFFFIPLLFKLALDVYLNPTCSAEK